MKKKLRRLLIAVGILAVLMLSGCPYSSTVPLEEPNVKVDKVMYGKWILESTDEFPSYYNILELDGTLFTLDKYSYDSETAEYYLESGYEAWFTDISGTKFLNIEDREDKGTYYFYKLEMKSPATFVLFEVTDNIDEVFTDSRSMNAFFKKYKDLSFFYNQGEETYNKEGN